MNAVREAIAQNQTLQFEWTSDSANISVSFIFASLCPVNSYGKPDEELRTIACSMMLFYCVPEIGLKAGQTHGVKVFGARRFSGEKASHTADVVEFISKWASTYTDWARTWQPSHR